MIVVVSLTLSWSSLLVLLDESLVVVAMRGDGDGVTTASTAASRGDGGLSFWSSPVLVGRHRQSTVRRGVMFAVVCSHRAARVLNEDCVMLGKVL